MTCWPELEDNERIAVELVEALETLDIDVEDIVSEVRPDGAELDLYPTPDDRAEYHAPFDADHTYQYKYAEDVATIELAIHTDTTWAKPRVRWRVNADAGTVAGTHGCLEQPDRFSVPTIETGEHVRTGDDHEQPIIATRRFSHLPVPREIDDELREGLEQLRSVTPAGDDLETDPTAFPNEITSSDDYLPTLEAVGWEPVRSLMWYGESDEESTIPHGYQIEHESLIHRNIRARDQIEGDEVTWQTLISEWDLELIADM